MFNRFVLATLSLAFLSACDAKPAEAPVVAAAPEAAPAPAPPPPLDAATAMAAIDQKTLCGLFARASTDDKVRVTKSDCVVTPGTTDIGVATKDGSSKLAAILVEDGSVVEFTPATVSTQSTPNATHGGFSNIGVVFIGRAPASGLCMSIEYLAPSGTANSAFVSFDPDAKGAVLDVGVSADKLASTTFAEPVVKGGAISVFSLSRREAGLVIKSARFKAC